MSTIKAIIIDDEQHCIDTVQWLIDKYVPNVKIVSVFTSPTKALESLNECNPDLIFLDIEMLEMSGFEFLKRVPEKNFEVIFTTAYDEFAIKAFKASAIDYLLKPIGKQDILSAVEKVEKNKSNILPEQIEILYRALSKNSVPKERMAVPTQEGIRFIKIKDILYCISDSNYTFIHLENSKKFLVSKTLKEIERILSENGFLRIHHSHMINTQRIDRYIKGDGGYVVMDDNKSLSVSRSRKEALLAIFDN